MESGKPQIAEKTSAAGRRSLRYDGLPECSFSVVLVQVRIDPRRAYRLSLKMKTDLRAGLACVQLLPVNVRGEVLGYFGQDYTHEFCYGRGSRGWHDESVVLRQFAPEVDSVNLYLLLEDAIGTVWFDEVRLNEANALVRGEITDAEYADFVRQSVRRYKNYVRYWQLGNEFDIFHRDGPKAYVEAQRVGYAAAKAEDPNCVILGGSITELHVRREGFREALELGLAKYCDVYDFHLEFARGPRTLLAAWSESGSRSPPLRHAPGASFIAHPSGKRTAISSPDGVLRIRVEKTPAIYDLPGPLSRSEEKRAVVPGKSF